MVEGFYKMTENWSLELPQAFEKKFKGGNLVFETQGLIAHIAVWDNNRNEEINQLVAELRSDISDQSYDIQDELENLRFCYRYDKDPSSPQAPGFFSFNVADCGHVQMAIYFDKEEDVSTAERIFRSISLIK